MDLKRLRREIDSGHLSSASGFSAVATQPAPVSAATVTPRQRQALRDWLSCRRHPLAVLAYLLRPTLPPPRVTGYTQITHDGQQKSFVGQAVARC